MVLQARTSGKDVNGALGAASVWQRNSKAAGAATWIEASVVSTPMARRKNTSTAVCRAPTLYAAGATLAPCSAGST